MTKMAWVAVFFLFAGVGCSVGAIQFKLGKMKAGFLPLPTNPQIPRDWPYGLGPGGIGSLLTGIGLLVDNRTLAMIGILGIVPFGLVLMAWKPRWVQPDWLLWLRDHYEEPVLEFMLDRARNDKTWNQQVSTQEGLETWAEEMVQQYRLLLTLHRSDR